jgi:murein DD-endopeptidase MepM/ murein hydrolase activator NlpD
MVPQALIGSSKFNILATAAMAVMLSACSSAVERFAANPSDSDPVYTASVPKAHQADNAVSDGTDEAISSKPLASAPLRKPAYNYAYKPPVYKAPAYRAPTYQDPSYDNADMSQDTAPQAAARKPVYNLVKPGTSSASVRVGPGMTLYSIAKANNTTVARLAAANNLHAPYAVSTGQVIRIPGAAQAALPATTSEPVATTAAAMRPKAGGTHQVAAGETLFSLGRKYGMSPYTIADANGLPHDKALVLGQNLRIPGAGAPAVAAAVPKSKTSGTLANTDTTVASAEPSPTTGTAVAKQPAAGQSLAAEEVPATTAAPVQSGTTMATPAVSGMRWPVKGKVISEFGAKPNGLKNEGINIAVPEGTGIRAAESGVVAYAGNELKGYGNLVLIRHDGGWVTAYAHAKELFVKRGDTVKRGDVIAKAGQTGSVSSPQLHFEVRKGATAMDPMKFLASTTASN